MKIMIAWLLSAVIVLGLTGTALAYDNEITFLGIPWGSSVEEVFDIWWEHALHDDGFLSDTSNNELTNAIRDMGEDEVRALLLTNLIFFENGSFVSISESDLGMHINNPYSEDKNFVCLYIPFGLANIAGYPCEIMTFCFVYGVDENGACVESETHLASIVLSLCAANQSEASDDLENKLTQVYGEGATDARSSMGRFTMWKGADHTAVAHLLGSSTLLYGNTAIYPEYMARNPHNPDTEREAVPTATPVPSNNVDITDTSGL